MCGVRLGTVGESEGGSRELGAAQGQQDQGVEENQEVPKQSESHSLTLIHFLCNLVK